VFFFCLSFFLSFSIHPANKRSIYTRVEVVVWRQWQLNSTCECVARIQHYNIILYKGPGGENRVLCFIIIAYYYYYYCCVHYNISAVVNFMHRWQTRVYIYEMRFLLCARVYTHVYNNMRTVQVGQCNIIYVAIHIIATAELCLYIIIICGFMYTYYVCIIYYCH